MFYMSVLEKFLNFHSLPPTKIFLTYLLIRITNFPCFYQHRIWSILANGLKNYFLKFKILLMLFLIKLSSKSTKSSILLKPRINSISQAQVVSRLRSLLSM